MELTLESLGLNEEELQGRLINALCDRLLSQTIVYQDEDGDYEHFGETRLGKALSEAIKNRIDENINQIAEKHVLPRVTDMVTNLTIQMTNQYGEKKGEPTTFIEYMVKRADEYLQEPLSYDGKTRAQDSYNWRASTTRVAYMVDKHLHYHISTAMDKALKNANESIAGGINAAVKIGLEQALAKLQPKKS